MKKVYCRGCKYLEVDDHLPNGLLDCNHPKAIEESIPYDTFYDHHESHEFRQRAHEVNKGNDCKWFEGK